MTEALEYSRIVACQLVRDGNYLESWPNWEADWLATVLATRYGAGRIRTCRGQDWKLGGGNVTSSNPYSPALRCEKVEFGGSE